MKKIFIIILTCISIIMMWSNTANACSDFKLSYQNNIIVGHNVDWGQKQGFIVLSKRGLIHKSMPISGASPISWEAKYGSITFTLSKPDGTPNRSAVVAGMNEQGLVAAILWLDESSYPPPSNDRKILPSTQWAQYMLDNAGCVQDVIELSKKIQIASAAYAGKTILVHLIVHDAKNQSAVLEYTNGKLNIYTGNELPLPIITNSNYPKSLEEFNRYKNKKVTELPGGYWTLARFVLGSNYISNLKLSSSQQLMPLGFNLLGYLVEPPLGDEPTNWSIVFDITHKKIYYRDIDNPTIREISMNILDTLKNNEYKACNIMSNSCFRTKTSFLNNDTPSR